MFKLFSPPVEVGGVVRGKGMNLQTKSKMLSHGVVERSNSND